MLLAILFILLAACSPSPMAERDTDRELSAATLVVPGTPSISATHTVVAGESPPTTTVTAAPRLSAEEVARWREDLRFLAEQIPVIHPEPFHTVEESDFIAAVDKLEARMASLSRDRIILELMGIVALLGEGHSFLSPVQDATGFRLYPLRLYEFSDGVFVVDAQEPYRDAIGTKVLGVGDVGIEEVYETLAPFVGRDNEMGLKTIIPVRLINANLLQASGLVADELQPGFRLQTLDGEEMLLNPAPVTLEEYRAWSYPEPLGDLARYLPYAEVVLMGGLRQQPEPLSLQARYDENFWHTFLEDARTLYIQYNLTTGSSPGAGTIGAFSQEIATFVATNPVERVVVDMRHNPGGDNGSYPPLLDMLTGNPRISQPGRLYIITGRHTGSAAVNLLTDLERRESQAMLVGEPTASRPNLYGDPRLVRLPNSGLEIYISSRYWEKSDPDDPRRWIEPAHSVTLASADFFRGRDPVLEWILEQPLPPRVFEGES